MKITVILMKQLCDHFCDKGCSGLTHWNYIHFKKNTKSNKCMWKHWLPISKTPWPCKVTQAIQANIWHPEKQHSSLQIYSIYESPQKEQSNWVTCRYFTGNVGKTLENQVPSGEPCTFFFVFHGVSMVFHGVSMGFPMVFWMLPLKQPIEPTSIHGTAERSAWVARRFTGPESSCIASLGHQSIGRGVMTRLWYA